MFEVEYDLAEEDLIHFNEKRFLNTEQSRKRLRFGQGIVPAILVMIGLFYGILLKDEYTGLFTVIFALVLTFGMPYFSRWEMRRRLRAQYTDEEKAKIIGHYKLAIEPKVLVEVSPSGENKMAWKELLRVEYGDKYVYIYIDIDTALVIPVRSVTSGDLEKFSEQADKLIDRYS